MTVYALVWQELMQTISLLRKPCLYEHGDKKSEIGASGKDFSSMYRIMAIFVLLRLDSCLYLYYERNPFYKKPAL